MILGYVGVKMILDGFHIHIDAWVSLVVICASLGAGVLVSVTRTSRPYAEASRPSEPPGHDMNKP